MHRRRKLKKSENNPHPGFETVMSQTNKDITKYLTVIFLLLTHDQIVKALCSVKVSQDIENLCSERVIELRYNARLNLIVVDNPNGMSSAILFDCYLSCSVLVRTYSS